MSRRPPPQNHAASSNDVPTVHSPDPADRPPLTNRAASDPSGAYDLPATATLSNRPLRSILTNPTPPQTAPRVRFLIPQSSGEIRDRLAGGNGLVDPPENASSSAAARARRLSDSDGDGDGSQDSSPRARRPGAQDPRDLSDIIGNSVRGFMRNLADRNNSRDRMRGPLPRGLDDSYRTRNSGSPAETESSSPSYPSPDLQRVSLSRTGRESPLRRTVGSRSVAEAQNSTIRMIPRSTPTDGAPAEGTKGPAQDTVMSAAAQARQRARPSSPLRRKSSGHDSYHGPGEADTYFYGTPSGEMEPGVYYGPPPPKMPTPPPAPAPVPPKYKPGGGSASLFYDPENADPDAAVPIEPGSQYELTIMSGAGAGDRPPQQPPQPLSILGGPITAEPGSTYPGGFVDSPVDSTHPASRPPQSATTESFSSAVSNPSYPTTYGTPQAQSAYHPGYPPPPTNQNYNQPITMVNTVTGPSAIDAATVAEIAYEQHLANSQRPTTQSAPPPQLSNLPPLPPSTAPTYASPYPPPSSGPHTSAAAVAAAAAAGSYRPPQATGPSYQPPTLVAPQPQHPNAVPAIVAATVAGGIIGAAASHSHSHSASSNTAYSQPPLSYIPGQPYQQAQPNPPPVASTGSGSSGYQMPQKPQKPQKPHKPSILAGILGGKRPSISSPTTSHQSGSGSGPGGKILAGGLTAAAAVGTALAGQSGGSSKPQSTSYVPTSMETAGSSSSNHHFGMSGGTAAIVAGSAALAVGAAVSHHHKDKHKHRIQHKASHSSSENSKIHGLKGKLNYSAKSNNIRGIKLPSAINAFDSASSSDFMFDSDDSTSSSSSGSNAKGRRKKTQKDKGKSRDVTDLSSSHSSAEFDPSKIGGRGMDTATSAIPIPGVVSDMNHSDDEGASPRLKAHMRKKSTDSDLAFGRSVGSMASGYTSDSSMYSTGHSPENGNGFQFWGIRGRKGARKAKRVSSRDSINSVNSALGWGDTGSSDEANGSSNGKKWLRKRESLDSNLAFGLSSTSTSRRSSYASGLRDKFSISEEDEGEEDDYDGKGRRRKSESPNVVKAALVAGAAGITAAEMSGHLRHGRRPSDSIIVAPGHRIVTDEQRMADYERLDKMRRQELERDIAQQKESGRLRELEKDRQKREQFDKDRMDRRRREEEFAREKELLISADRKKVAPGLQRHVSPFYFF